MNVAVLDPDVSYPTTSGKRLRTLNLLLKAAERHKIFYLGRLCSPESDHPEARRFLSERGIEPTFVHDPLPKKAGPGFYARLAGNLLSPYPYSVASHLSPALGAAAEKLASERRIDVWQAEWPMLLPLVPQRAGVPRVTVAHNVESLIWQRYWETATNPLKKAFLRNQWKKFERCERTFLQDSDRVVAVSEPDADLIREQFGQPNVDVVDNGVDPEFYAHAPGPREAKTALFLGALDWRPNQDGVGLLLDKIFPEVRRQVPDARLWIVGRNPPAPLVERARATAGVELHADVPDVRPFLGQAGMLAVPLRIGGGSRLKILEALAANLPVVASRVGAEGLSLEPGEHYVSAEEDAMAAAIVAVMRDPGPIRAMAERGRAAVRTRYDWGSLAKKLEASWEAAIDGMRARRPAEVG